MNFLKVNLWGEELGRLVWNPSRNTTYFIFNPENSDRPDVAPIMHPVSGSDPSLPVYGDSRRIYQGLPSFIADVAKAATRFPELAEKYKIPDSWKHIILKRIPSMNINYS